MQQRCTCKKEIIGWYFNFDNTTPKFDRCDVVGERMIKILRKMKAITHTQASISQTLYKIEITSDLHKWFLREVKKQTHKTCYGWQCKMKIVGHNKLCKIHNKKKQLKKEKK